MMDYEEREALQSIIDDKNREIDQLKTSLEQERAIYEKKIQEVHDYYNDILAVMPGHVYWLDKNNVFLGCNNLQAKDAKLNSREEIVGKTNYDMLWKDQADELNRLNNLVMETGLPHTAEEYAVMANGLAIYFSQKTPLCAKNGEVVGVLGVSIDITERKKMEVALRRTKEAAEIANLAKTEFIANMSHDIHTPLSGIVGLSQFLEIKMTDPELKQAIHWIKESGKQLIQLLNGVIDSISDDTLNDNELNDGIYDVGQIIQGIVDLVLPSIKVKALDLIVEMDDTIPGKLITDGTKLHRVLLNIVGNAIKFTKQGSVKLKVDVVNNDREYVQLKFTVRDTGIGIAKEYLSNIFDRFFCVDSTVNEGHGNPGVGLHVAQKYVVILGSEIKVESELHKGSTFDFTLSMKVV